MIDTEHETAPLATPLPTLLAFAELGQDKAAVGSLYQLLLADIEPGNLIERLWVRALPCLPFARKNCAWSSLPCTKR